MRAPKATSMGTDRNSAVVPEGSKAVLLNLAGEQALIQVGARSGRGEEPITAPNEERAAWRPSLGGTSPMNYSQIGKASYRLLSIPPFPPFLAIFVQHSLCISSFHYFHFFTGAELCIVTVNHQRMLSGFSFSLFLLRTHSAVQIIKSIVHTKMNSVVSLTLITPHITDFQTSKRTQKHHKSAFKCLWFLNYFPNRIQS